MRIPLTTSHSFAAAALLLLAFLVLPACSSGPRSLSVRSDAELNRNDLGESTPATLRIYQLKNAENFRTASYETLWTDIRSALGDDLLAGPVTTTVYPGSEAMPVEIGVLKEDTRAIGILYLSQRQDPNNDRRLVIPVDDLGSHRVFLRGYSILSETP